MLSYFYLIILKTRFQKHHNDYYTTFLSDLLRSQISNNSYYCHPFRVIIMIIVTIIRIIHREMKVRYNSV